MAGESDLLVLRGRFEPDQARVAFGALAGVEVVEATTEALRLALPDASHKLAAIFASLAAGGAEIRETTLTQPSLETLFIKLTGRKLRE